MSMHHHPRRLVSFGGVQVRFGFFQWLPGGNPNQRGWGLNLGYGFKLDLLMNMDSLKKLEETHNGLGCGFQM